MLIDLNTELAERVRTAIENSAGKPPDLPSVDHEYMAELVEHLLDAYLSALEVNAALQDEADDADGAALAAKLEVDINQTPAHDRKGARSGGMASVLHHISRQHGHSSPATIACSLTLDCAGGGSHPRHPQVVPERGEGQAFFPERVNVQSVLCASCATYHVYVEAVSYEKTALMRRIDCPTLIDLWRFVNAVALQFSDDEY